MTRCGVLWERKLKLWTSLVQRRVTAPYGVKGCCTNDAGEWHHYSCRLRCEGMYVCTHLHFDLSRNNNQVIQANFTWENPVLIQQGATSFRLLIPFRGLKRASNSLIAIWIAIWIATFSSIKWEILWVAAWKWVTDRRDVRSIGFRCLILPCSLFSSWVWL